MDFIPPSSNQHSIEVPSPDVHFPSELPSTSPLDPDPSPSFSHFAPLGSSPLSPLPELQIPFLSTTPYTFGTNFWNFPRSHGYGDQWASLPAKNLAGLAQEWLWFGVLSEFLGRSVRSGDFRRRLSGAVGLDARYGGEGWGELEGDRVGRQDGEENEGRKADGGEVEDPTSDRGANRMNDEDDIERIAGMGDSNTGWDGGTTLEGEGTMLEIGVDSSLVGILEETQEEKEEEEDQYVVNGRKVLELLNEWIGVRSGLGLGLGHGSSTTLLMGPNRHRLMREQKRRSAMAGGKRFLSKKEALCRRQFLTQVFALAEDLEQLSEGHVYPLPTVLLSVKVLCCTLDGLLGQLCRALRLDGGGSLSPVLSALSRNGMEGPSPSAQGLLDFLRIERGWCSYYLRKLAMENDYAALYYYSHFRRGIPACTEHNRCSEGKCVATGNEEQGHMSKHVRDRCQCRPISANQQKIREILLLGGIPILQVKGEPKWGLAIRVKRLDSRMRFVVLSHAGAGSVADNIMYGCRLRQIQGYLDGRSGTKSRCGRRAGEYASLGGHYGRQNEQNTQTTQYFWLDTLCIPAMERGSVFDEARAEAINKIPAVFAIAEKVLVLDPALERTSLEHTPLCERLALLAVSPWMNSMSSSQATMLGRKWEVQCADGTFDPFTPPERLTDTETHSRRWPGGRSRWLPKAITGHIIPASPEESSSILISNSLAQQFQQTLRQRFSNSNFSASDTSEYFVTIWNHFADSIPSAPNDAITSLSSLLSFNTQPLLRLSTPAERLAVIISKLKPIPLSLFLNAHLPRERPLANHRNRWMPSSTPSNQNERLISLPSETDVCVSEDGELRLSNTRASRKEVQVLVCIDMPKDTDIAGWGTIKVRNAEDGRAWEVNVLREDWEKDEMATDERGVFCFVFVHRDERETEEVREGALFRVRKVNTGNNKSGAKGRYSDGYGYNKDSLYDDGSFESGGVSPEGAHVSMSFADRHINKLMPDAEDLRLTLASHHVDGVIQVVYDCSLTLIPSHDDEPEPDLEVLEPSSLGSNTPQPPLLTAIPLPLSWQMVIEREPPSPSGPQTLTTRPPLADVTLPPTLTTHFLLTALDGLLASTCVGFTLGILGTSFPFLPMIANAALIGKLGLHCVFVICMFWVDAFTDDDDDDDDNDDDYGNVQSRRRRWANRWKKGTDAQRGGIWQATNGQLHGLNLSIDGAIWDVLHIAMVVLYTVALVLPIDGRKRRPRDLDKAFIGWSILGHLFSMMVKLVVRGYVLGPLLLDRYLASFEDGSAADNHPEEASRKSFQWNEKGALMVEVRKIEAPPSHDEPGVRNENVYDVRDQLPSQRRHRQGHGLEKDDMMVYEEWDRASGRERPREKQESNGGQEKSKNSRRNRLFGGVLRRTKALRLKSTKKKKRSKPSDDSDNFSNVAVVGQGDDHQDHEEEQGRSEVCLLAELEG